LVATRLDNFDFTATGYVVALTVGMLLSTRFPSPAHRTPPRLILRPSAWRSATPPWSGSPSWALRLPDAPPRVHGQRW